MQSEEESEEAGAKETRREAVQAGRIVMSVLAHVWDQLSSRRQRKRGVFKEKLYLEGYWQMFVEKMEKWEALKLESVSKEISQSTFI